MRAASALLTVGLAGSSLSSAVTRAVLLETVVFCSATNIFLMLSLEVLQLKRNDPLELVVLIYFQSSFSVS